MSASGRLTGSLGILIGLVAGVVCGVVLGPQTQPLGEVGKALIQLIKILAGPLLFFAIVRSILETSLEWASARRLLGVSLLNAALALTIALVIVNVFQPGTALRALTVNHAVATAAPAPASGGFIPQSLLEPFTQNSILSLVMLAVLSGLALRAVKNEDLVRGTYDYAALEHFINTVARALERALGWIVKLAPFAVFSVVARSVGEHGLAPLMGLGAYLAAVLAALAIHSGVVYQAWVALFARRSLKAFWREAREPVIYSAGANSSLATLPLTLRALDRLGVSRKASTLGACVGTNLNNDGILLYEAIAALIVAQAYGIPMGFDRQLVVVGASIAATLGITGIPEAGFISLSVVLTSAGLPAEILPTLLAVDWIVARARSMTNVMGDMTTSIILDRMETSDGEVRGTT